MSDNNDKSWSLDSNNNNNAGQKEASAGLPSTSLLALLGEQSLLGSQRDVPEVNDVQKKITERVEAFKRGSLSPLQLSVLPVSTILTRAVSNNLPGLALHRKIGDTVFLMPVLFSNRSLTLSMEDITIESGQNARRVSMPLTPVDYVNNESVSNIIEHFKTHYRQENVKEVTLINFLTLDLEQFNTEETLNYGKDVVLTDFIMNSWEQGLQLTIAKISVKADYKLPVPFQKGNAYGKHNTAIARVEPIIGQVVSQGQPSSANLKVLMQTSSNNNFSSGLDSNREIVTAFATVTLQAQSMRTFTPRVSNQNYFPPTAQSNGRLPGYYPLTPVVVYNYAKSGEVMGDNTGLATFIMGLFAVLSVNSNYLFTEGLRGKSVGARGNLSQMESIVQLVEAAANIARPKASYLTDAKLNDVDATSAWLRENVAPKASFAFDVIQYGRDSAINNFIKGLANPATAVANTKTFIKIIDSLSKDAASELIRTNIENKSGWTPTKPIFHKTSIIVPFGSFRHDGRLVSLGEVDEMMLAKIFPNDNYAPDQWRAAVYGNNQMTDKVRKYEIRRWLNQMFNSDVNLNGFGTRMYIDPEFAALLVSALSTNGTLQATGSMGTFNSNVQTFAENTNFAVDVASGQSGGYVAANNVVGGNGSDLIFGG